MFGKFGDKCSRGMGWVERVGRVTVSRSRQLTEAHLVVYLSAYQARRENTEESEPFLVRFSLNRSFIYKTGKTEFPVYNYKR